MVVRGEYQALMHTLEGQLLPELRSRRDALRGGVQSLDMRQAEVRSRCAEAEREGREEFEALRGHLNSVETLKQAVLARERDVRLRLMEDIDAVERRVQQAKGALALRDLAAFVRDGAELRAACETLRSRSLALPRVEVPVDDIPFEARTRADKLRRFAVMQQLHRAKDLVMWSLEQQRRRMAQELQDAGTWLRHLEALLDRYSDATALSCYFCAENFGAGAANGQCPYNTGRSPRSGRPLQPDARVPPHLWGAGAHFWAPQRLSHAIPCGPLAAPAPLGPQPPSAGGCGPPPSSGHVARGDEEALRDFLARQEAWPGAVPAPPTGPPPPSGHAADCMPPSPRLPSKRPMASWEDCEAPWLRQQAAPPYGAPPYYTRPSSAYGSPREQRAAVDALLRRIAFACEQRGLDVRSAFCAFDANGDGFLSAHEFVHALARLGLGLSEAEASGLLAHLDANVDGLVSYEEFLTQLFRAARDPSAARVGPALVEHFAAAVAAPPDAGAAALWQRIAKAFRERGVSLRQVFALFDSDGDGVVSRQELAEAFRLMRLSLSDGDVERLMRDIDANQDGRVGIHEFINRLQQA